MLSEAAEIMSADDEARAAIRAANAARAAKSRAARRGGSMVDKIVWIHRSKLQELIEVVARLNAEAVEEAGRK